jgi:hypothetical protein
MKRSPSILSSTAVAAALALLPAVALAHDGHGKLGPHWHESDVWAYVAVAAVAAGVAWLLRRK